MGLCKIDMAIKFREVEFRYTEKRRAFKCDVTGKYASDKIDILKEVVRENGLR